MVTTASGSFTARERLHRRLSATLCDDGRNSGPFTYLLYACSWLYGRIVAQRVQRLQGRPDGVRRLACPVISVGNLTTGGTGKTPMTAYLAGLISSWGLRPVILSRGYGGRAEQNGAIVSSGSGPGVPAAVAGDEAYLLAQRLPDVPVVVGRHRYAMGKRVFKQLRPDCYLLDDGFQHVQLHRDLNLVLLDYRRPFGNGHLLPRGHLREPLTALGRADALILTRSDLGADESHEVTADRFGKPVFRSAHRTIITQRWRAGRQAADVAGNQLPAEAAVFIFSGLADNAAFWKAAGDLGARIVGGKAFSDHHPYTQRDVDAVALAAARSGASALLTSAKDFVRLPGLLDGIDDLYVADAELAFKEHRFQAFIQRRLLKLRG